MSRSYYAKTSGARVPHPGDPFWKDVVLLAPFSGGSQLEQIPVDTSGIDLSRYDHQLQAAGGSGGSVDAGRYYTIDPFQSLPVTKYGETTAGCNTADTTHWYPGLPEFLMGVGDFTIEMDAAQQFAGVYPCCAFGTGLVNQPGSWCIGTTPDDPTKLAFYEDGTSNTPSIVSASSVWGADDEFVNIAYSRVAGVGRLFANGVLVGSGADSTDYTNNTGGPGYAAYNGLNGWKGFLANIRWTAAGRYTANYKPPSGPFPTS